MVPAVIYESISNMKKWHTLSCTQVTYRDVENWNRKRERKENVSSSLVEGDDSFTLFLSINGQSNLPNGLRAGMARGSEERERKKTGEKRREQQQHEKQSLTRLTNTQKGHTSCYRECN